MLTYTPDGPKMYLVDSYSIQSIYPYPRYMRGDRWHESLEEAEKSALAQSIEHPGKSVYVYEFESTGHYGKRIGVTIDGDLFRRSE